jgi:hypothetical protein
MLQFGVALATTTAWVSLPARLLRISAPWPWLHQERSNLVRSLRTAISFAPEMRFSVAGNLPVEALTGATSTVMDSIACINQQRD